MEKMFRIDLVLIVPLSLIMMRIPISTPVLDILIAVNLLFVFTIFIALISIRKILMLKISLLFILLLISMFFSTAVNTATVRSILISGNEFDGRWIRFVSSLLTGSGEIEQLINVSATFIIIILICLIVITKAEFRVTELADRFTFDSMQVKLIAIETEYSSGEINEEVAASRKFALYKKSDFLGAMDCFVKFSSYNVKLNLFIIAVIVAGGTLIDTLYKDIYVKNAIVNYIPLAVGSGILFMLPSFLLSIAVGCLVKREIGK